MSSSKRKGSGLESPRRKHRKGTEFRAHYILQFVLYMLI